MSKDDRYDPYALSFNKEVRGIRTFGVGPKISFKERKSMQILDLLEVRPRDLLTCLSALLNSWSAESGLLTQLRLAM